MRRTTRRDTRRIRARILAAHRARRRDVRPFKFKRSRSPSRGVPSSGTIIGQDTSTQPHTLMHSSTGALELLRRTFGRSGPPRTTRRCALDEDTTTTFRHDTSPRERIQYTRALSALSRPSHIARQAAGPIERHDHRFGTVDTASCAHVLMSSSPHALMPSCTRATAPHVRAICPTHAPRTTQRRALDEDTTTTFRRDTSPQERIECTRPMSALQVPATSFAKSQASIERDDHRIGNVDKAPMPSSPHALAHSCYCAARSGDLGPHAPRSVAPSTRTPQPHSVATRPRKSESNAPARCPPFQVPATSFAKSQAFIERDDHRIGNVDKAPMPSSPHALAHSCYCAARSDDLCPHAPRSVAPSTRTPRPPSVATRPRKSESNAPARCPPFQAPGAPRAASATASMPSLRRGGSRSHIAPDGTSRARVLQVPVPNTRSPRHETRVFAPRGPRAHPRDNFDFSTLRRTRRTSYMQGDEHEEDAAIVVHVSEVGRRPQGIRT